MTPPPLPVTLSDQDGDLVVTARRLDAPGAVQVDYADGNSRPQVTGIRFPGAGCYEVSDSVPDGPPLTFVPVPWPGSRSPSR